MIIGSRTPRHNNIAIPTNAGGGGRASSLNLLNGTAAAVRGKRVLFIRFAPSRRRRHRARKAKQPLFRRRK